MNRHERRKHAKLAAAQQVATHPQIYAVACEMAGLVYEESAKRDPEFYARYPSVDEYVRLSWGLYVESARSTLAKLLSTNIPEALKAQIHEAIIADNSVRHGRGIQVRM